MRQIVRFIKKYSEAFNLLLGLAAYCILAYCFGMPCPIKYFTGVSCPGCGMTRSLLSLLRLDLGSAVYYHPLVFYVIFALPCFFVFNIRDMRRAKKCAVVVTAALFFAVYFYRLAILKSPVVEFSPEEGFMARIFVKIRSLFL